MAILDRATLKNTADTRINDNTNGDVSPADIRDTVKDLADSNVNRTTDVGTVFAKPVKMEGQTVTNGSTTFNHNAGHPARHVTFQDENGWPLELPWRPKPGTESTEIEVKSAEEITNVEINITCYT